MRVAEENSNKGITLIALVITIIVLLILAGVSIATLTGENGILTRASDADVETRAATVEEKKNLWKTEKQTDNYTGENTAQTLEELLNDLEGEKLITAEERTKIEETGHVVIGSKDISFSDGLTEASYTITSSLDEVNFNKIITEGDIAIEKPGFTSYAIEGISASKEGEYVTSGSVAGKSGNLEIVGDINDATFKYTLTNFMQGDETFYCKINIDGEEHYKEIKVIQGDVVTYEEDFAGIVYSNGAAVWVDDYNENYTNGKAKKTDTSEYAAKINFTYIGRGCEVISRIGETGWLQIVGENGTYYIDTGEGLENEMFQVDVTKDIFDNLDYCVINFSRSKYSNSNRRKWNLNKSKRSRCRNKSSKCRRKKKFMENRKTNR